MTLAAATLSAGQKDEFYRRKGKLTSEQRECLDKIFRGIADQGTANGIPQAQIIQEMADFIRQTVLGKGNPNYCDIYQKQLDQEYK
jgi:hypothetical protein